MSKSTKSPYSEGKPAAEPSQKIGPHRASMGEEAWSKLDNFARLMLEGEELSKEEELSAKELARASAERARQRAGSTPQ